MKPEHSVKNTCEKTDLFVFLQEIGFEHLYQVFEASHIRRLVTFKILTPEDVHSQSFKNQNVPLFLIQKIWNLGLKKLTGTNDKIPVYLNDSWVMLMKSGANETFQYDSPYWTTANTLNFDDSTTSFKDAKYDSFNNLSVSEIKIVSSAGYEVILGLPSKMCLLSYFQSENCCCHLSIQKKRQNDTK